MDSFEINKIIGAILGSLFIIFSIGIVSDGIFESEAPEKFGFAIEAKEAEDGGTKAAEDTGPEAVGPLLASADVGKGESIFKKCAACHTDDKGGANKVGPNLWNVVNRPVASHEGFSYSSAMQEFSQGGDVVWDYEHLNHFLLSPKKYISGTAMGFAGLKKIEDRADIIAYLRTMSDNPAPLPEPKAEQPAEESAAAGEETTAPADDNAEMSNGDGTAEETKPAE